jgi:hypothetical protein
MPAKLDWSAVLASLPAARTTYPKCFAIIDASVSASQFNAPLSPVLQRAARTLVTSLLEACQVLEPLLVGSATESVERTQWRADVLALSSIIAEIDAGSSSETDPVALTTRIAAALPSATPGQAVLLRTLKIPSEPAADSSFNTALAACAVFF